MKHNLNFGIVLVLFTAILTSCGASKEDAVKLSDKEYFLTNKCITAESTFLKSCKTLNKFEIENKLNDMLKSFEDSKELLKSTEVKSDLIPLKEAAIKFVDSYMINTDDYKEYARISGLPDSLYTKEEENKQTAIANKINSSYDNAITELRTVERSFAAKYDFKLLEEVSNK